MPNRSSRIALLSAGSIRADCTGRIVRTSQSPAIRFRQRQVRCGGRRERRGAALGAELARAELSGREPAGALRAVESRLGHGHVERGEPGAVGGRTAVGRVRRQRRAEHERAVAARRHAAERIAIVDAGVLEEFHDAAHGREQADLQRGTGVIGTRRETVRGPAIRSRLREELDEHVVVVAGRLESGHSAGGDVYRAVGPGLVAIAAADAHERRAIREEQWHFGAVDCDVGIERREVIRCAGA